MPILAQESLVHHTEPYTNYIDHTQSHLWSHLRCLTLHVLHNVLLSIMEVMRMNHTYYGVFCPIY